jgi:hypothetical protein
MRSWLPSGFIIHARRPQGGHQGAAAAGRPSLVIHVALPPDPAPAKSHAETEKHRMWISSRCWEGGGIGGGGGSGATVAAAAAAVAGRPSLVINVPLPLDPVPDKSHADT